MFLSELVLLTDVSENTCKTGIMLIRIIHAE